MPENPLPDPPGPTANPVDLPSNGPLRVLFVGNSLTYTNDLPSAVGEIAEVQGKGYSAAEVALPGVSLEDHWGGTARGRIAEGGWDVVVMQQGPSTLDASRTHLVEWVSRFSAAARAAGATPAVYMVWPPVGTPIERSERSYAEAAESAGAVLLPAGRAWRVALEASSGLGLYGPDGFHPSPTGTLLAALVIYGGLYGDLPASLPEAIHVGGADLNLSSAEAEGLLTAARAVLDAD